VAVEVATEETSAGLEAAVTLEAAALAIAGNLCFEGRHVGNDRSTTSSARSSVIAPSL
jgi:hypothetical protein